MRNPLALWESGPALAITGLLALAVLGAAPAPTAQDDPYLWLEDVQGEKPLAWVKEQNAKSTSVLEAQPEYKPIYERALQILDSKEKIPEPTLLGETVYNFWKDDVHERGIWRRTTLASYRTARPEVGDRARRRRAREGGGQELGLPRGELPAAVERAVHGEPLARGLGHARVPRVRHEVEDVRRRRLRASGGEVARGVARSGHALGRHGLRPGLADDIGIPADREALEAGHAALRSEDDLRGQAGGRRRLGLDRDPLRRPLRHRAAHAGVLPPGDVPPQGRPPRQARHPGGLRTARLLPRPAPLLAAQRLDSDERRKDLRRRDAPRREGGRPPERNPEDSTSSSSRARASRSRTSTARATASCSSSSTTSRAA